MPERHAGENHEERLQRDGNGSGEQVGIPAVVCGPGSISQAHKPNEFIEISQVERCEKFVESLLEHLS